MKKVFLIFALLSLPAFATDIPYTNDSYTLSTCDSGVLQHDSGTVRLRAKYEPNTINIRWYNNNTELNPTNTAANTCDYDDDLTLPNTQPTRTGYTFAGWRVRPTMDFRTLNFVGSKLAYGKGILGGYDFCSYYNYQIPGLVMGSALCQSNDKFVDLQQNEWKNEYTNGTLYGMSMCSKKPGDRHSWSWSTSTKSDWQTLTVDELDNYVGENATTDKRYCWCKVTGWKENSEITVVGNKYFLAWVFIADQNSTVQCARGCAEVCGRYSGLESFYNALFTPIN